MDGYRSLRITKAIIRKGNDMTTYIKMQERISIHGTPVETIRGYNIVGDPTCVDIYYCGDMWAVVAKCEHEEETEYFTSLSAARDYAHQ